MKFRIMQGVNSYDGTPIFRVYEIRGVDKSYRHGATSLEEARAFVERQIHPEPETLIEEIDAPVTV